MVENLTILQAMLSWCLDQDLWSLFYQPKHQSQNLYRFYLCSFELIAIFWLIVSQIFLSYIFWPVNFQILGPVWPWANYSYTVIIENDKEESLIAYSILRKCQVSTSYDNTLISDFIRLDCLLQSFLSTICYCSSILILQYPRRNISHLCHFPSQQDHSHLNCWHFLSMLFLFFGT